MLRVHILEERDGVAVIGPLGWVPGTAAIASVVQQEQGVIRKRLRKACKVGGDILAVASEVDDGLRPRMRPYRDRELRLWHMQRHCRFRSRHCTWLWVV